LAAALEEEQPKGIAEPKRTGKMVNAQNKQGEKNVWGKRSEWMDYSGTVDGQQVGIAIFDTPGNSGFPTYWHARGYGLFAANPLGQHIFDPSAKQLDFTMDPSHDVTFRYRVLLVWGPVNSSDMNKEADEFATEYVSK